MILPDWVVPSVLITIIGFFLARYLHNQDKRNDLQDKKYDLLADGMKQQGNKFIDVVQELRDLIASLRISSASQKTLAEERHKSTTDHLERVDQQIGELWKAHNNQEDKEAGRHNELNKEINEINRKLSKHGHCFSEKD